MKKIVLFLLAISLLSGVSFAQDSGANTTTNVPVVKRVIEHDANGYVVDSYLVDSNGKKLTSAEELEYMQKVRDNHYNNYVNSGYGRMMGGRYGYGCNSASGRGMMSGRGYGGRW